MIYTVTLNPSIDYIMDLNYFQTGIVNRSTKEIMYPGGKGINVSVMLKNLEMENTALGFIGGFTGKEILRMLEEIGISEDFVRISGGESRINVKLRAVKTTEVNAVGPKISVEETKEFFDKLDKMCDGDYLVLSGSIPSMITSDIYVELMEIIHNKDAKVIVDTTGEALSKALKLHPFLIKPNLKELSDLFGDDITADTVERYIGKLWRMGATNMLISMSEQGAILATEDKKIVRIKAPIGTVVNSVGSGDAMVAGFIYGYEKTGDYTEALKYAVAAGSATAFSEGLATKEHVMKLYDKIDEEDLYEL